MTGVTSFKEITLHICPTCRTVYYKEHLAELCCVQTRTRPKEADFRVLWNKLQEYEESKELKESE